MAGPPPALGATAGGATTLAGWSQLQRPPKHRNYDAVGCEGRPYAHKPCSDVDKLQRAARAYGMDAHASA